MRFTYPEEYGVRCLLQMARDPAGIMTIHDIASREGLTPAYVAKLMRLLRQGGLVRSVRGKAGGYRLTRPPKEITVEAALAPLGTRLFSKDFCREHSGERRICVHNTNCSIRSLLTSVDRVVQQALSEATLSDLLRPEPRMEALVRANRKTGPGKQARRRGA